MKNGIYCDPLISVGPNLATRKIVLLPKQGFQCLTLPADFSQRKNGTRRGAEKIIIGMANKCAFHECRWPSTRPNFPRFSCLAVAVFGGHVFLLTVLSGTSTRFWAMSNADKVAAEIEISRVRTLCLSLC